MAQAVFAPVGQPFCAWTHGSRKFAVQLHADVLARLGMEVRVAFKRVPRRGLEIGGILVGRTDCRGDVTTFWIEGFESIDSEHRSGPSYILSEPDVSLLQEALGKNGTASIGIYRSQTRSQQLLLQEPDTQLFERCFGHGDALFLIACPVAARAAFFVREDGELKCVYEFGLGSTVGASATAHSLDPPGGGLRETDPLIEAPPPPEIQPALLAVSRPIEPAGNQDRQPPAELAIQGPQRERVKEHGLAFVRGVGTKKGTWLAAALIFSALLGAGIGMFSHAPRPPVSQRVLPAEDLHLTVEGHGGVLRLYWDANSSAVHHPSRAVLHIQDGDYQIVKNISSSELSAGSVAYEPRARDVSFRVEMSSPTANASGVVQVVNLSAPPAAIAVRPAEPLVKPSAMYQAAEMAPKTASPLRSEPAAADHVTKDVANDAAKDVAKDKEKENVPPVGSRSSEGTETAASIRRDPAPTTGLDKEPRPAIAVPPAAPVSVAEPSVRVWPEAAPGTLRGRLMGKVPLLRRLRKPAKPAMPTPIFQAQPVLTKPAKESITQPVSVDVRVDVGESGVVEKAEVIEFSDPLNVAVTNSALAAAVRWTFQPARSEEDAGGNKVILHFRFTP